MKIDIIKKQLRDYDNQEVAVHVMLPDSYEHGDDRYPVVYIQDGQCVFYDEDLAGFPSWGKKGCGYAEYYEDYKNSLPEIILVGIDSMPDGKERTLSYSPGERRVLTDEMGREEVFEGNGHLYAQWLVGELKPLIDSAYRTLPDCGHTAIGGFSSGASASLYILLEHPGVFSRLFLFGSAVWLWDYYFREAIPRVDLSGLKYVYSLCGTNEVSRIGSGKWTLEANREVFRLLLESGVPEEGARFYINEGGTHSLPQWKPYFPDALRWIFQDKSGK